MNSVLLNGAHLRCRDYSLKRYFWQLPEASKNTAKGDQHVMKVKALVWVGIKTDRFQEMEQFLHGVMGMPLTYHEQDFTLFQLPSGDKVEIFGPDGPNQHFAPDSIVCGFLVEDIRQASQELIQAGIELVGPLREDKPGGYAWQHFRGPDGKLYELSYDPERG